jgi:hypothetical protein
MSDHIHDFDPISGWCSGCTVRDDGRHLWLGGDVTRRPQTYPSPIAQEAHA